MNPQEALLLCRGAGGVGSFTLNRNFIREFGTDATILLSDMFRAYHYGEKIHTNINEWFLWNPTSLMNVCRWHRARFDAALDVLMESKAFKMNKFDDEIRLALEFDFLQQVGGSFNFRGDEHEKEIR